MTSRRAELLRRGGVDPILADARPLSELLNDEIPYDRWDKQLRVINRAGYSSVQNWLHGKLRIRKA